MRSRARELTLTQQHRRLPRLCAGRQVDVEGEHIKLTTRAEYAPPLRQRSATIVPIEGDGYLSLRKDDRLFRRTDTRLVYDDLKHLIRFSAGDVPLYTRGFQGTATVAGISASRFYSVLEPARQFRSSGSQSFTLFSPSTVETIANGQSLEHRLLQPGTYTIQDFPLAEGSNDVR